MLEFFKWCDSLSSKQAWTLFACITLILFLIPYLGLFIRLIQIIFSGEKAEIVDFSWRIAPSHLIHQNKKNQYYYLSTQDVLFVGCPIILTWTVKGAYRIEISPNFRNLKENSLITVVRPQGNNYTLIAHTFKGKIQANIQIPDQIVKQIKTVNFGGANAFDQPEKKLQTKEFSKNKLKGKILKCSSFISQPRFSLKRIKRLNSNPNRMPFIFQKSAQKQKINFYIAEQKLVKKNFFNPSKYNQVLNPTNQKK